VGDLGRRRWVRAWWVASLGAVLCVGMPRSASAYSLLPLTTEQAETLPSGVAEATLGVAYFDDMRFPPFTPPGALRSQTLIDVPQFGFRVGAGGWVEIQATYETIYLNEQAADGSKNWQFGSGDLRMFTKVWLARERRLLPALAIRFGTKLPDANRSARLGTDDTDFGADGVFSKHLGPVTMHVNLGLLLLGNSGPTIGHSFPAGGQDDTLHYSVALVSPDFGKVVPGGVRLRLLAELHGLAYTHYDNEQMAAVAGVQMQRGPGTLYVGASAGLITASENVGASAGFIYAFDLAGLIERFSGAQ
jgi:hypothetical protein